MAFKKVERFQDCEYCKGTGDDTFPVSINDHKIYLTIAKGCQKCDGRGKIDWVKQSKDLIFEQKMKYQLWVILDTGSALLILAFLYFWTDIDLLFAMSVFLIMQIVTYFFVYQFYTSDTIDARNILKSINTGDIPEDFSHLDDEEEIDVRELEKRYEHLVDTPKKRQKF